MTRVRRSHMTAAILDASALAGPIFCALIALFAVAEMTVIDADYLFEVGSMGFFLLLSVPFGFILAFLPCFLAGHALLGIARSGDGDLDPGLWLVVGGASSAALGYAVAADDGLLVMMLLGALLASFARKRALDRAARER